MDLLVQCILWRKGCLGHKISADGVAQTVIHSYEQEQNMDPNLFRMAKLDYNIVQSVYTKECSCTSSTISSGASADENLPQLNQELENQHNQNFWKNWREQSAQTSACLVKLGLVAVLACGLFDAITYSTFFVLTFLAYEKSTGHNPIANIQVLLGRAYSCLAICGKQRCFMKDTSHVRGIF